MKNRLMLAVTVACAAFSSCVSALEIPVQAPDAEVRALLPARVLERGVIRNVIDGSFPPYYVVQPDKKVTGAMQDFAKALSEIMAVRFDTRVLPNLPGVLMGLQAGRYDVALGPIGDYPEREKKNDFLNYVKEQAVFAVRTGNPKGIRNIGDVCGKKIAVAAGGSGEQVIRQASAGCVSSGKPRVTVMNFDGQPQAALAVQSGRADAFFSSLSPLRYFMTVSPHNLELAGLGEKNGFENIRQGAVFPKNSDLEPAFIKAFEKLFANGTYKAILEKYGIGENLIERPFVNQHN